MDPMSDSLATALQKPGGRFCQALAEMLPGTESFGGAALLFSQLPAKNRIQTPGYTVSPDSTSGV